ncbi:hypothetical protein RU639_013492 [Aspergillus parasiticus]
MCPHKAVSTVQLGPSKGPDLRISDPKETSEKHDSALQRSTPSQALVFSEPKSAKASPRLGPMSSMLGKDFVEDLKLRDEYEDAESELKDIPCGLSGISKTDYYWTWCLGSPCLHGFFPRFIKGNRITCPASFEAFKSSKLKQA